MKYKLLIFLVLLLIFPLVSSNGLNIIKDSIKLNKTFGIDKTLQLTIRNEETFDFKDITFKEDWVNLDKFNLASGENKTVTITITKDTNFNGVITLIGEYYTDIGASNITEDIKIDYDTGFSQCNLNLIKGDKVTWVNNVLGEVKLINSDTSINFLTILENTTKSKIFNYPQTLNYYASWIGFQFTTICHINVMNDSGYVHNQEYDDTLNLDLSINYNPTTISVNFPKTNYTIEYNRQKEDILTIENTGTQIAKNIKLSGDWFTFTKNNFDLNIGDSVNIGYTINPYVIETNQTGKNYSKILKIEGNFGDISKSFNIYIPYKNIISVFNGEVDEEVIYNFFKSWCKDDYDSCVNLFCSVYPKECENGTLRESNITQSFSGSTIKELIQGYATLLNKKEKSDKSQFEIDTTQTNAIENLANETSGMRVDLGKMLEKMDNISIASISTIIFLLFLGCCGILYILIFKDGSKNSIKKLVGFHKGEKIW